MWCFRRKSQCSECLSSGPLRFNDSLKKLRLRYDRCLLLQGCIHPASAHLPAGCPKPSASRGYSGGCRIAPIPSALRWPVASGGLCGAEKGQPGLSVGTLPSRCPCEIRWREQGSGHSWAWLHPPNPPAHFCSGFSWEHLTSVDLESQLWSQNLTLGNTAAEPEQEWTVTPVMTDIELN